MFASTKLIAAFSVVAAAAAAVLAAPAVFDPSGAKIDIVYRPHLTSPVEGDSWPIGSQQTVTWDASDIPPEALYQTGVLLLGHLVDGSSNEHLDIENPLASGFQIKNGAVNVTVPKVFPRSDYIVVLIGDSGNASGKFSITLV
ncbi:hypothetical protein K466DRAFT_561901 [Polyporus arcularius HHB13444]|uniref:Uncharacterized protein n=2 Tax=Polyporaceae TaxID=5317 RepID=A0A5C3PYZ0_9APHY|nr:hypothetical protein OH76DRAFT_1219234 [Polyporus brumalis]TFK93078.1 hypothetical protein K466DRAFT_561901 [Polyporus arcularius HHB13444]